MRSPLIFIQPLLLILGGSLGCAGYQWGAASLYPTDIRTVHVPLVASNSFRRQLGERLTEAIAKQIEQDTPYKVVNQTNADSVLRGRIVSERKRVLVENANDNPRDIEWNIAVEYTWIDHRGNPLMEPVTMPLPTLSIALGQAADFVPEAGQSMLTAQNDIFVRVAQQVVGQMESPW